MKLNTASFALATTLLSSYTITTTNAFTPIALKQQHPISTSSLYSSNEETVRDELKQKTTLVDAKDEIKYDSGVSGLPDTQTAVIVEKGTTDTNADDTDAYTIRKKKLERILKPRAYPLFLAEKAALIGEEIVDSIFNGGGDKGKSLSAYELYQQKKKSQTKEKIVILGTGWGSAAFLKGIDTNMYDVTVISPRNFFLFTPMLAGASVGTVDFRSITESVREINRKVNYLEGSATEINPENKTISCDSVICEGNSCAIESFDVPYDRLIVTVGAQTNTYGIPGVREYCCFLKQIEDARRIRNAIVNCFERANLPSLDEEARKSILTFAVIGAGPTGVEFASELRDFIEQDGPKYYPELLKYVRIKVIEASPTVLAPFDKSLQDEAIKQLTRGVNTKDQSVLALLPEEFKLTELLLNSGVSEVKENVISLNDGTDIPYGLAVWAAGNGPLPITLQLIDVLGKEGFQAEAQSMARGRLAVDSWLRVLNGDGSIFSFGDCSCITAGQLPATAQVASQQGEYLARLFSMNYNMYPGSDPVDSSMIPPTQDETREKKLADKIASFAIQDGKIAAPFQFLNLGILAYTGGGSALAQLQLTPAEQSKVKSQGKIGFSLWRSVYLSKQVSWRNRCLVTVDWLKTQIFGRDVSSFD